MLKTIFLGTPSMAVPFLEQLHQASHVVAVLSSPDQPAGGAGMRSKRRAVKIAAREIGSSHFSAGKFKRSSAADQFGGSAPNGNCGRLWKTSADADPGYSARKVF